MSEQVIKTIHKARVAGMWTEFWFKENLKFVEPHHTEMERFCIEEGFDTCIMTDSLIRMLEREKIQDDVLNYGLKNRKILFGRNTNDDHWQIISFIFDTRIVLIEKME